MTWNKHRRRRGGAKPDAGPEIARAAPDRAAGDDAAECGCGGEGLPLLADSTCDPLEVLTISLVRFAMDGYCGGRVQRWDAALRTSIEVLGPVDGPPVLARTLALVLAVRSERRRCFRFLPSHCGRISEDEMELLAVLQAARRSDADLLHDFAASLVDRPDAPQLKLAARALAALLDRLAKLVASDRGRGESDAATTAMMPTNATRH